MRPWVISGVSHKKDEVCHCFCSDRVHDDDYDRPRRQYQDGYDRPRSMNVDVGGGATAGRKPSYPDGYDRPRSTNFQLSGEESENSVGSASTAASKVVDDMHAIASMLGTLPPPQKTGSGIAANPLYDPLMKERNAT